MPFRSKAQQRFMFAKHPAIAKRWASEYGVPKNLPDHKEKQMRVKPKPKRKVRATAASTDTQQGFMQSGHPATNKIYKRERHKNRRFHQKHDGETQRDPRGSEAKGNPNAPTAQQGRYAALQEKLRQGKKHKKGSKQPSPFATKGY